MGTTSRQYEQPQLLFAAAFLTAVIGFWPSFFTKLGTTDLAHLVHGVTATAWMAIPIVQAWLITHDRPRMHRYLGRTALVLAPLLVASALHMVQRMILRYEDTHALRLLKFAALDLTALALFVAFLFLAVRSIRRGDVGMHARYMASTVLFALEPAIERVFVFFVPGVDGFAQALYLALISMEVIVGVLLFVDWRRQGRLAPPFLATLAFFIGMHIFVTPVANSAWFQRFAIWFAGL